ncbi:MAG: hypothetical protein ABSB35_19250 [Bryobacteraceae bacterium]
MDYRERFRMAWEMTWPMALIDLAFVLVVHGLFEPGNETWDSVWALISFVVVWPWVIRRALRQDYGGKRVRVVRTGTSGDPGMLEYQESLKVMWLLAWRSLILLLLAGLAISLILKAAGWTSQALSTQSALVNNLGLSFVDAISDVLFFPILIPGMLRKSFRGFRLVLAGVEPAPVLRRKLQR